MHNLSSVYFIKQLYMFQSYLKPVIRGYTIWIQQFHFKKFSQIHFCILRHACIVLIVYEF